MSIWIVVSLDTMLVLRCQKENEMLSRTNLLVCTADVALLKMYSLAEVAKDPRQCESTKNINNKKQGKL